MLKHLPAAVALWAHCGLSLAQVPVGKSIEASEPPPSTVAADIATSYADAVKATENSECLALVVFFAPDCKHSSHFRSAALADKRLAEWLSEQVGHPTTIITCCDVDTHVELAGRLQIQATPTLIAYGNGAEAVRSVGDTSTEQLIERLNSIGNQEKPIQVRERTTGYVAGRSTPYRGFDRAYGRLRRALFDEDFGVATSAAIELWAVHKLRDNRGSAAASFRHLFKQSPDALQRFRSLRDDARTSYFTGDGNPMAQMDWIILNDLLGETEQTLAWFDRAKRDPQGLHAIEQTGALLEPTLVANDRISEICLLYPDPLAQLRHWLQLREKLLRPLQHGAGLEAIAGADQMDRRWRDRERVDRITLLHVSLLLAERRNDAKKYAAELFRLDDSGTIRVAMVRAALQHRAGSQDHWAMLDAADKAGEAVDGLRIQLEQQAGKPNTSSPAEPGR